MKFLLPLVTFVGLAGPLTAADPALFTNFIRQVQLPTGVQWDASVAPTGEQLSALEINPGGARFELWTVKSSPLTSYLLDTRYVGTYVPVANVVIKTEDPYTVIPRTRADRAFTVQVTTGGLLTGATVPEASKSVSLLRHVQSYGIGGNGENLDRTQATMLSKVSLVQNGLETLRYELNSVPGADRVKVRGEERFSVFSLPDYQAPESQLASQFVQIWPVADGSISGISEGEFIRFALPQVTLTINDMYPDSRTYAQVYKGAPKLGMTGTIVPGSHRVINNSIPQDAVLILNGYDEVFDADGLWTMELVTATPFGIDRLAYVSFTIDRTIELNGTFTTIE